MVWTHKYDLLVKLLCVAIIALPIGIAADMLESHGVMLQGGLFMALMLGSFLLLFALLYYSIFRTVGSMLYARFTLKMDLSFDEARKFNSAFAPLFSLHRKWLPMKDIMHLGQTDKLDRAYTILQLWNEANKSKRTEEIIAFKNAPLAHQVNKIVLYILAGYCIIAGIANLPPATYVSKLVSWIFNDDTKYYPTLNMCLLILPLVLVYALIDKAIKRRASDS